MAKRHPLRQSHSPVSSTFIAIAAIIAIVLLAYFFANELQKRAPVPESLVEEVEIAPIEESMEEPEPASVTGESTAVPPKSMPVVTRSVQYKPQQKQDEPKQVITEIRQNITFRNTTIVNATYRQEARVRPMT